MRVAVAAVLMLVIAIPAQGASSPRRASLKLGSVAPLVIGGKQFGAREPVVVTYIAADETTRKAYPVTINGKRVRRQSPPIWRSAQGTMGRYFGEGEFRDGRRRSLIARRLHHVDHDPRTLRSRLKDAVRDHDQCVEGSRWGRAATCTLPRHRQDPSSALKEKINPSQKRRYMAKSRAPGSDLRRGPGVLRRLNLSHGLALVGSFGLGVWGGRVLVHGNRVLLAPFFQDLRPASPYG